MLSLVSPEMHISAVDLRSEKDARERKRNVQYDDVLRCCQSQIVKANERDADNILFRIPEFKLGRPPIRNLKACIAYVLINLKQKGFRTNFIYPDVLFVCWGDPHKQQYPIAYHHADVPVNDRLAPPPPTVHVRTKAEKLLDIDKTVCRQIPDSSRLACRPKGGGGGVYDDDAFASLKLLAGRRK